MRCKVEAGGPTVVPQRPALEAQPGMRLQVFHNLISEVTYEEVGMDH